MQNIYDPNLQSVEVKFAGICGSDINKILSSQLYSLPVLKMGHEIVGINSYGEFCVVNPFVCNNSCIKCICKSNIYCEDSRRIGSGIDKSGFSGCITVPNRNIFLIPTSIHPEVGILTDGAAVVFHALHLCDIKFDNALIIGDGPIGILCALIFSQKFINSKIYIIIRKKTKREILVNIEIPNLIILSEEEANNGKIKYDLVIECVGGNQSKTLDYAISTVKHSGTILVFGAFNESVNSLDGLRTLFYKQIRILGINSFCECFHDFEEAFKWTYQNEDLLCRLLTDKYIIKRTDINSNEVENIIRKPKLIKGYIAYE